MAESRFRPSLQGVADPFDESRGAFSLFSFTTHQNAAARAVMAVQYYVPEGSTLIAEFESSRKFENPVVAGKVDFYEDQLILELTPYEVNAIKSGYFRIVAAIGNTRTYVSYGSVTFVPAETPLVMDGNAVLTEDMVATVALTGKYDDLVEMPDFDAKIAGAIQTHVINPEPHPVYDDLPSLNLLFENGMM